MEITNQLVMDGLRALQQLEAPGKPLKLSALTRLALGRNTRHLKDCAADVEQVANVMRARGENGRASPEDEAQFAQLLKTKVEVQITQIKIGLLDLETNSIPFAVLGDLLDWMILADKE